tara:strand:+ start:207 stop:674 length:468 start_codon:yes stop_codon:yes gene_type:complete
MAVPSSGTITMSGIYSELANDDYDVDDGSAPAGGRSISLEEMSDGTVVTINTDNASSNRPDGSAPHAMSEFYSYDHDLSKSDIRLKTNIQLLGHSDLNIPIYSFKFKNDLNTTYKGTMAQDLIKMGFDDSVVMGDDGFYSVKYENIDVDYDVLTI